MLNLVISSISVSRLPVKVGMLAGRTPVNSFLPPLMIPGTVSYDYHSV